MFLLLLFQTGIHYLQEIIIINIPVVKRLSFLKQNASRKK